MNKSLLNIKSLTPPLPWDKPRVNVVEDADVVICLHGLWRSVYAMEPVAQFLNVGGFTTVNVPYASFRYELSEIVTQVRALIEPWLVKQGERKIHFVTHSLGGVVVRKLLEDSLLLDNAEKIGRVVMLAPPHLGSEIVDWLSDSPVRHVLGPAGEFLSTRKMEQFSNTFPAEVESAVIMGEKSALPFFRSMLDESNDGIVSVEKGRLYGIKAFKVIDAGHTFIASDAVAHELTLQFLKSGNLD